MSAAFSTTSCNETNIRQAPTLWLADPGKAMGSVIAVNVWRGFPFFVITMLAGLQAVPQDLYDAAKVDGAGIWARFCQCDAPEPHAGDRGRDPLLDDPDLQRFLDHLDAHEGRPRQRDRCALYPDLQDRHPRLELGKGVAVSVLMLPILVVLIVLLNRFINRREEIA